MSEYVLTRARFYSDIKILVYMDFTAAKYNNL